MSDREDKKEFDEVVALVLRLGKEGCQPHTIMGALAIGMVQLGRACKGGKYMQGAAFACRTLMLAIETGITTHDKMGEPLDLETADGEISKWN